MVKSVAYMMPAVGDSKMTDRQTDRQTDRHTDRQIDRQIDRQTKVKNRDT